MRRHKLSRQQEHFLGLISGMTMPMAFDSVGDVGERRKGFLEGVNFAMQVIAASGPVPKSYWDEDQYATHLVACAIRRGLGCTCHEILAGRGAGNPGDQGGEGR